MADVPIEDLGYDSTGVTVTWKGEDAVDSDTAGDSIIKGGAASGDGDGGKAQALGGTSAAGNGGSAQLKAGNGGNNGGTVVIRGGNGGVDGGSVSIYSGAGTGGTNGDIDITAAGFLYLNLPTVDPAVAGALWADSGVVKVSAG